MDIIDNRLIQQGAVSIDGTKVENATVGYKNGNIIKVGKHRFLKVLIKEEK
jgi:hypothetical protein